MEIIYQTEKGIAKLKNPQMLDISMNEKVEFVFTEAEGVLELNKMQKYFIKNNKCQVNIKDFLKGTNTLRIITDKITPCQPLFLFDVGSKLHCSLATSLDVLETINILQDKVLELQKRIADIEKLNVADIKDRVNSIIELIPSIQERINALEVGFDPTVMAQ